MVKEKYRHFVKEPEMIDLAWYREYRRIDYEAMKESEIEEAREEQKRISLNEGREEGRKQGKEEGIIYAIQNIMLTQNVDCKTAMTIMGLSKEEKMKYCDKIII